MIERLAAACGVSKPTESTGCYYVQPSRFAGRDSPPTGGYRHMTDELTIEQLLEPSTVLSRALDFMETDLDADAYNVISAWVARAIREIGEDLARAQAIDEEALKGLPAARMKIEGGKLWLRIFEQIQKAIPRYAPAGEG